MVLDWSWRLPEKTSFSDDDGSLELAQASDDAPIFQGDVIEIGGDGAIGGTFADDSTFSLADEGRMVIDEMVYDPATQSGKSAIDITQVVFR